MEPLASIADPKVARHLLDPLRARILALARDPMSASQLAERVELPRQRVNYHVKQLREAGLLVEAGRRDRRNLTEVLYLASAQRYLIDASALGALAPSPDAVPDKTSAAHLAALAARVQSEAARSPAPPALQLDLDVRLAAGADREAFARAVQLAVSGVVDRFGGAGQGHRLVAGCYQKPAAD